MGLDQHAESQLTPCSHSLQEKSPDQEPIPIVLRETVAYLQAHGECYGAQGLLTFQVTLFPSCP